MKHSPLRSFHDWILGLLHATRRPFAGPVGAADTPAPAAEGSEFVPTVPWRIVFATGEQTAVEVTCPYCESCHRHLLNHLLSDGFPHKQARKKARERDIVFEAPCGWGKYRLGTLGQHEDSAWQEV